MCPARALAWSLLYLGLLSRFLRFCFEVAREELGTASGIREVGERWGWRARLYEVLDVAGLFGPGDGVALRVWWRVRDGPTWPDLVLNHYYQQPVWNYSRKTLLSLLE